jgi:hypothetical protein
MQYKFQRFRKDKIPRERILQELEAVAKEIDYTEFSPEQFNRIAKISAGTVKNEFHSWKNALVTLKNHLAKKGINLKSRKSRSSLSPVSTQQLFDEMERIWNDLGHRPSISEWNSRSPKIATGAYRHRFNGWNNACLKFIEHKMGKTIAAEEARSIPEKESGDTKLAKTSKIVKHKGRTIPLRVRLQVLARDNFRCTMCGRSPATDVGVKLHIDHITPFSKGGLSTADNLQTLCNECNAGKSDRVINRKSS